MTAFIEKRKESIFMIWLTQIPTMTEDTKMSFEEYYSTIVSSNKFDTRPADEIIKNVLEIQAKCEGV